MRRSGFGRWMMFTYHEPLGLEGPKWDGKLHVLTIPQPMKTSIAYVGTLMGRSLLMGSTARYL
jgi:hypothetical protein